jgi:hypothetical protein
MPSEFYIYDLSITVGNLNRTLQSLKVKLYYGDFIMAQQSSNYCMKG